MRKKSLLLISLLLAVACNNNKGDQPSASADSASQQTSGSQAHANNQVSTDFLHVQGQFCYITKIYTTNDTNYIEADYIRFLTGSEAVEAARKRGDAMTEISAKGDTTYSLPDDIYIINENKQLRQLPVAKNVAVYLLTYQDGQPVWKPQPLSALTDRLDKEAIFVLTIQNGVISRIVQQYLP